MKALLLIVGGLLGLFTAERWGDERQPLLIDAQMVKVDHFCDFPKTRGPLPKFRRNPMVNGLDKPNGEVA